MCAISFQFSFGYYLEVGEYVEGKVKIITHTAINTQRKLKYVITRPMFVVVSKNVNKYYSIWRKETSKPRKEKGIIDNAKAKKQMWPERRMKEKWHIDNNAE